MEYAGITQQPGRSMTTTFNDNEHRAKSDLGCIHDSQAHLGACRWLRGWSDLQYNSYSLCTCAYRVQKRHPPFKPATRDRKKQTEDGKE